MSSPGDEDKAKGGGDHRQDDLSETKRIMERLARTPPKPHKPRETKRTDKHPKARQSMRAVGHEKK